MKTSFSAKLGVVGTLVVSFALSAVAHASLPSAAEVISRLDKDKDGTLNWSEVQDGALAEFKKLDQDNDGTVDAKEWKAGGLTAAQWEETGVGKGGTLTQDAYLSWTKKQFIAADPDKDGTVSTAELSAPQAKGLLKVLR